MLNHDDIVALSEAVTLFRRLQAKDLVLEEWPSEEEKVIYLGELSNGFRHDEQAKMGVREDWEQP